MIFGKINNNNSGMIKMIYSLCCNPVIFIVLILVFIFLLYKLF